MFFLDQELNGSPMQQDNMVQSDQSGGNPNDEKPGEVQQNSLGSHSPVMNGGEMFNNVSIRYLLRM